MPDLDALPDFPRFLPLDREHRDVLAAAMAAAGPDISELTFAYQWAWRRHTHCRVSRLEGTALLMLDSATGTGPFLLPPVTADPREAARLIASALRSGGEAGSFARVPEGIAGLLRGDDGLAVREEPERADYVYAADDMRELAGARFARKRNHVHRFWSSCPQAQYREMDAPLTAACTQFCKQWLAGHAGRDLPGLRREAEVTLAMLAEREWLGLGGGALVARDRVVAFALGEAIRGDTFVVRVEKADTSVPGAYQAINQEFARHAAAGFRWINREQDLGVPGLRRAKQSYYPHHLVRKCRATVAH